MKNIFHSAANCFYAIPSGERRLTVPTVLTLMRIALAPFIVGAMINNCWNVAFFLFVCASVTDVADGFLARLRNEQTFLGACLDPIADKILLLSIFFTLAFIKTPLFHIPLWFVLLVLVREMIIVGGALLMYAFNKKIKINPTLLGKMTTVSHVLFITWLFACYFFNWHSVQMYCAMIGGVTLMVCASLVQYVMIGVSQLRETKAS